MPPKVVELDDHALHTLFTEDLKRSGITGDKTIAQHRLVPLNLSDTEVLCGYRTLGTAFVYPDLDGKDTDFVRVKFLKPPPKSSWPTDEKPGRYWQAPNSTSRFYFPACRPWRAIAENPSTDIFITEGEKKAICASLNGLNCIGIAGVSNWRSSRRFNQLTVPDMDLIQWEHRRVFLCFDADMVTNPLVTKQLNDLSAELTDRGVRVVKVVEIPATTELGSKCGLDDYISEFGFPAYQSLIEDAQDVKDTAELWRMNEDFAFVNQMGAVYDCVHRQWITKTQFFDRTAPLKLTRIRIRGAGADATVQADPIPANQAWWEWRCRRTYGRHDYLPGCPAAVDGVLNTWRGYGTEPEEGPVRPFLDLFEHVAGTLTYEQQLWLWQWLAYPLQHPEAGKLMSAVMVHSRTQGSGKSYIGELLADLYGPNAVTLNSPEMMFSPFNEWLDNRQLVVADEVLVGSRRETDRVKNFVTATSHTINPKGIKAYEVRARMNWYLTSNHDDALKLTSDDRRWFVVHAQEKELSKRLIGELRRWRERGGVAHLHHFLLNEIDTESFKPWARPVATLARDQMIHASASEAETWCLSLRDDPDSVLSHDRITIPCDLFTETDWREANLMPQSLASSSTTIRNILRNLGFEQRPRIRSKTHWPAAEKKLWCLRHREFWAGQSNEAWAEHYAAWLKRSNRYLGVSKVAPDGESRRVPRTKRRGPVRPHQRIKTANRSMTKNK